MAELVQRLPEAGMNVLGPSVPSARSTLVYYSHPDRTRNAALHKSVAEAGIHVSSRGRSLRASPHLHNGSADIDRLVEHLRSTSLRTT